MRKMTRFVIFIKNCCGISLITFHWTRSAPNPPTHSSITVSRDFGPKIEEFLLLPFRSSLRVSLDDSQVHKSLPPVSEIQCG